ncbi:NADPH:quinone oxidoreductase family protein [Haliea sp.]|jgi:NADPH2:quinone reductase|uniref:NADPH:quinone oxidoreductase family protein n=1 Tax=Haliea TaxID=475794 RepID=UPI000C49FA30|nr:NADPH:quinone oxidoreductase family protein [Haliea sp.]HAN67077.1 NADPH:quinone oxidoreductase [Halieaceae bacterium]MAD64554.1 NADPH:quinone oxidoreductase [Haliea sp.]MAY93052.1 NADPH:quinone oxidoreductase [Haliea sp.]MBK39745.1 NADPH:quinone oxidoreductase [Haliea sp.]MBP69462.1 NADPH:quinone oxidoreductase [Haliea sp.]|tara:strand:+ start:1059 stop:2036 length:978 start_codon:yes stop_codon:yes gene_type:complete
MKAVVCKEHGLPDKLSFEAAWPDPEMGDDDVLIDVKAAGLNFPDVLIIQNKYQTKPDLPFIPGGECSGVVVAVGKNVKRLQPGEKVISMGAHGAFCSRIAANQHAVFPMPDGLTFEQAAGVAITYFTSYHALKQRANLQPGETLLVLGAAGGVGTTAVELGKLMGARVIAAASTDEKLALCKQLGADELINYSEASLKDTLKELTGGKGVDVVYDPVGGDYSEPALRSMAWNGRYLVIGFASGPIPSIPLNLALLKGCSIVGVFWGRFMAEEPAMNLQNIHDLWALFAEGKLKPVVTDLFALEDYEAAYACMMERRARGKVILTL